MATNPERPYIQGTEPYRIKLKAQNQDNPEMRQTGRRHTTCLNSTEQAPTPPDNVDESGADESDLETEEESMDRPPPDPEDQETMATEAHTEP